MSLIGRLLSLCVAGFGLSACVDDMQPPVTSYSGDSARYASYSPPLPREYVVDTRWVSRGTVTDGDLYGAHRTCSQRALVQVYSTGRQETLRLDSYKCGPWRYPHSSPAYVGSTTTVLLPVWIGPGYYHHPHGGHRYYGHRGSHRWR